MMWTLTQTRNKDVFDDVGVAAADLKTTTPGEWGGGWRETDRQTETETKAERQRKTDRDRLREKEKKKKNFFICIFIGSTET